MHILNVLRCLRIIDVRLILPSGIRDTQKLQLTWIGIKKNVTGDFSEVCEKKVTYVFSDCGEIICDRCTCCEDENPKYNDDLIYSNQDY